MSMSSSTNLEKVGSLSGSLRTSARSSLRIVNCITLFLLLISPFFTGSVQLSLHGEQLTIDGLVTARDGTYNPYIEIYDSQVGIGVFMPKGVFIDLAEMRLMYDSGKLPVYVTYVSNVDTDLPYEESNSQLVVFLMEASIYPL